MPLIFGFDIGTTSIGFAAIEFDPAKGEGRILRMGSRIFPEARDPKGTPFNQTRRQKRLMRRQLRRRKDRRRRLNEALLTFGLLPRFGSPEWTEVMAGDPVALRARAAGPALLGTSHARHSQPQPAFAATVIGAPRWRAEAMVVGAAGARRVFGCRRASPVVRRRAWVGCGCMLLTVFAGGCRSPAGPLRARLLPKPVLGPSARGSSSAAGA